LKKREREGKAREGGEQTGISIKAEKSRGPASEDAHQKERGLNTPPWGKEDILNREVTSHVANDGGIKPGSKYLSSMFAERQLQCRGEGVCVSGKRRRSKERR